MIRGTTPILTFKVKDTHQALQTIPEPVEIDIPEVVILIEISGVGSFGGQALSKLSISPVSLTFKPN